MQIRRILPEMPQDVSHRPVVPQCPPSRCKHQSPAPRRAQTAHGHQIFSHLPLEKQTNVPAKNSPPPTRTISHHTTLDSPLSQNHNTNLLPHLIFRLDHFSPPTPFPQHHRALLISILTFDSLISSLFLTLCVINTITLVSSPREAIAKTTIASLCQTKASKPSLLFPLSQAKVLTKNQPLPSLFSSSSSCPEPVTLNAILLLLNYFGVIFASSSHKIDSRHTSCSRPSSSSRSSGLSHPDQTINQATISTLSRFASFRRPFCALLILRLCEYQGKPPSPLTIASN